MTTPSHVRLTVALTAMLMLLASCGGTEIPEADQLTSADVVEALAAAGLEAESPSPMTPPDFGIAPVLTDDATRFLIPSLGEDAGGRAFVFDATSDLEKVRDVYDQLGRESGLLFSWTFTNEAAGVLVQINGTLPETQASEYETAVDALGGV